MDSEAIEHRTFSARLECHYLVDVPPEVNASTLIVAALHGFGSNPEMMLRLTEALLGRKHVIAALQAPSQFFLAPHSNEVGYCWATHKHSEASVRLHHEMLLHVFDDAERQWSITPERRLLVGFSQPVGMNYRFAATHPEAVRGVLGLCGGVPKNWEEGPYQKVRAALLHIARTEDEFYPPSVTGQYAERLRLRADDVEFHMMEGGHRFPSKAGPVVGQWMGRVFGGE
jgi:predicted esterase